MSHRCGCKTIGYGEAVLLQGGCRPGMAHLGQALARGVDVPVRPANDPRGGKMRRAGTLGPHAYSIPSEVQVPIGSTFIDGGFHDRLARSSELQGATGTRFVVSRSSYPQAGVATAHGFDQQPGVMDVLATLQARERAVPGKVSVAIPPMPAVPYHTRGSRTTAQVRPSLPGTPSWSGVAQAGGLVMGTAMTNSTRTPGISARPAADVSRGTGQDLAVVSPFGRMRTLGGVESEPGVDLGEKRLERALVVNTWVWTGIGLLSLVGLAARSRRSR